MGPGCGRSILPPDQNATSGRLALSPVAQHGGVAMRKWSQTGRFAATLLAVLFAVALRGMIPAGYMPDVGPGGFTVTICGPGGGNSLVLVDADGQPIDEPGSAENEPVCAFAGPAADARPDHPPRAAPLQIAAAATPSILPHRQAPTQDRSQAPPPPARAPPA